MKIGIETKNFEDWGGGVDFIRHIASCIEIGDKNNELKKHILITKNDSKYYFKTKLLSIKLIFFQFLRFEPLKWITSKAFDQYYMTKTFSDFYLYKLDYVNRNIQKRLNYVEKEKFDTLIPCSYIPNIKYKFNWIGYIYDFQHKYLPEYFSEKEINQRDINFSKMLNNAEHVIVNAKSVKLDAEKFIGNFKAKIHVLPFSPNPREKWLDENRNLNKIYGITKPYFIICNQFWIHKDHVTAFKAFKTFLEREGKNFQLVCTGETSDFRFPNYFKNLINLINRLKIKHEVKIVGHIPKLDQIALLKKSIAVIQPTLFEGGPGGGAAYDAISLGKPLIVSNIDVNLEIEKSERIFFFKSKNISDLSSKMSDVSKIKFNAIKNDTLKEIGYERKKKCGELLIKIIKATIKK